MSVTDELLAHAEAYAAAFDKGSLPLPPAKQVAVGGVHGRPPDHLREVTSVPTVPTTAAAATAAEVTSNRWGFLTSRSMRPGQLPDKRRQLPAGVPGLVTEAAPHEWSWRAAAGVVSLS